MRVAVLTSSRADYGIYLPLLKKLRGDDFFELSIIAFGTHLSTKFDLTVEQIKRDGFDVAHELNTLPEGDKPVNISKAIGTTTGLFSELWEKLNDKIDLVFCLGDRYEMFAAVVASIPFNIRFAHIHGGEATLGAMDEKFRHSLTVLSEYHFVSTVPYAERVKQIKGKDDNIHVVGALSLDNLREIQVFSKSEFYQKYHVDLNKPTVLLTFHPETILYERNSAYCDELIFALNQLEEQIIITMPNADTEGDLVRKRLQTFISENDGRVFGFESLGTKGYFSCMTHCAYLLGNTSSGIIEAASFGKYVINIGDRQKGRISGNNVISCPIDRNAILQAIDSLKNLPELNTDNIYGSGNSADEIIKVLKKVH